MLLKKRAFRKLYLEKYKKNSSPFFCLKKCPYPKTMPKKSLDFSGFGGLIETPQSCIVMLLRRLREV
jgi:hypothetical protein